MQKSVVGTMLSKQGKSTSKGPGRNEQGPCEDQSKDQNGRSREQEWSPGTGKVARHLPSAHAFPVGHTCYPSWVFRGNRNQKQFFPPLFFVLLSRLWTKASLAASYRVISAKRPLAKSNKVGPQQSHYSRLIVGWFWV